MVKIIERSKSIYSNLGYHVPERTVETKDIYEARAYVKKQLELLRLGDSKWNEREQNFDSKSIYLSDGYTILWYEMIVE